MPTDDKPRPFVFGLDSRGAPVAFFTRRQYFYGNDGHVYVPTKQGLKSVRRWYVRENHGAPVIRRDKLNDPQALEALRWRLLQHHEQHLLPRFKKCIRAIYDAGGSARYACNGNVVVVTVHRSDDPRCGEFQIQTSCLEERDLVTRIGSIDALGEAYYRVEQSLSRSHKDMSVVDEALQLCFTMHIRRIMGPRTLDVRTMAVRVNGRLYPIISSFNRRQQEWPYPTDVTLDLDDLTNRLDTTAIYDSRGRKVKKSRISSPSAVPSVEKGATA